MSEWSKNNWKSRTLSDLADYYNGRAFKPSEWQKKGLPIIRIAQLNDRANITDYCDPNDLDNNHIVETGDLLFSWSATLKAITWKGPRAALNQHIFKVQERGDVDKTYLRYLLETSINKLAESSHGSTMKHIKKGVLDDFTILLPPLAEQKKIAEILSSVDEVIENTESEISKVEDLKKATSNELLTKGIGHTEFKDSEIGRIPKSWKVVSLGDVVKFGGGSAFSESIQGEKQGDFPFIKVSDMSHIENMVWIVHSENWITKGVKEASKIKLFPVNAVVFAKVGAALMLNRRRILSRPTAIDNNMMAAIPHDCESKFLYWLMSRIDFRRLVQDGAVPSVNQSQLEEIVIALPNTAEQKDIAVRLDFLASVIEEKTAVRDGMVSVRAGLLQDLLTGKVRVKVN